MAEGSDCAGQDIDQWFENAVLVYGPRKGGTTLLQNLFDGSDSLFVYPTELKLKSLIFSDMGTADGRAEYARESRVPSSTLPRFDMERYKAAMDGLPRDEALKCLNCLIRADLKAVRKSAGDGAAANPKGWAAKEVGGRTEEIVRWWLDTFENARVVFITRDPLMVTRAILRRRQKDGKRQSIKDVVYETVDTLRTVKAQQALMDHPKVFAVAYEDLVADPAASMARVAKFLDIPFDDCFTRPTIFGEPVVVRTASKQSTDVFRDEATWSDGLTWRERMLVQCATALSWLKSGSRFDYPTLRALVQARAV